METIFMIIENRKASKPQKFVVRLPQGLDLRSSNKHVALQNLFIYYTQENIGRKYRNNKLKIIAPTWNDKFALPESSYLVPEIQDYTEYIIKNMKHYPLILLILLTSTGLIID